MKFSTFYWNRRGATSAEPLKTNLASGLGVILPCMEYVERESETELRCEDECETKVQNNQTN